MRPADDLELKGAASDVGEYIRLVFGPFLGPTGATRLYISPDEAAEPGFLASGPRDLDDRSSGSVDCVLANRMLHLVPDLVAVVGDIHRVLKADGTLCIVSPYGSSDDAWSDPRTRRALTEHTWAAFNGEHVGIPFTFEGVHLNLVPAHDLQLGADGIVGRQAELQVKKRFLRNCIREMHVVLKKVERA